MVFCTNLIRDFELRYKEPDDDFFLRDNRNWTSTRDSHLELAEMAAEVILFLTQFVE